MVRQLKIKIFLVLSIICLLTTVKANALTYKLEFPLPGLTQVTDPGEYIRYFFIFGLGLVGFLAVAAIVVGGILYMTVSTVGKVDRAKQMIWGAITGLVLLLCSYALLYIIDPSLVNLSPLDLSSFNTTIPKLAEQYDLPLSLTQGKTAAQVQSLIQNATLSGSGTASCSLANCGSQNVDGSYALSTGAAANYLALQQQIQQACAAQGLTCSTQMTSTTGGQHTSTCHVASNTTKGGTCGDFVITTPACGGSIKLCSAAQQQTYMQIASGVMNGSSNVTSCLNEYIVAGSALSTGGHYHCNL